MATPPEPGTDNPIPALLARVLEAQRFAESKHGVLLTLNIAASFGLFNFYIGPSANGLRFIFAADCVLAAYGLSAILSLLSFGPRLTRDVRKKRARGSKNILYFGDIATMDEASFKSLLSQQAPRAAAQSECLDEYVNQIVVNSEIATEKFVSFGLSLTVFAIAAIATFALFIAEITARSLALTNSI